MLGKTMATCCGVLVMASLAMGQAPRFRWQTGQVLVYRIDHNITASYVMGENTSETKTRVQSLKRWQVMGVDAAGTATLQMTIQALMFEMLRPDGKTEVFDSAHPENSPEEIRKQFAYVGQPLLLLRVDGQGKVIEIKQAQAEHGSMAKFESDPPFKLLLPAEALRPDLAWERPYQITLEPPQGAGEKYDAVQRYQCKSIADGVATVALATELKNTPAAAEDQIPLWQMQPQGDITFDARSGRLLKATLRIDKEAKIEGGNTRFQSIYTEQYAGDR